MTMNDERKTKAQLIEELSSLRQQAEEFSFEREKLNKVFNYAHDAIFLFDPEHDLILDANPSAANVLGYTLEELKDLPISAIHPKEMDLFLSFFNSVVADGDGWTNELTCTTKKNSVLPTEMSASLLHLEGRECMIAILRDITDRKNAELRLQQSEETYRDLFESAFDAVFLLDKDRNLLDINSRGVELSGYLKSELLSMSYYDLVLPADREHFDGIMDALTAGEKIVFEMHWRSKQGNVIHFEGASTPRFSETGEFISTRCTLRDITDRVKAKVDLENQLQKLAALNKIDRTITASLDLQVTLETILDQIVITLGVDAADILILNPQTKTFEFGASLGFRTDALRFTSLRLGEGLAGQAAFEQRVINIPNLGDSSSELASIPRIKEESFVSYHALPLKAKGQVKGILEIFHRRQFTADPDWLAFLETLARQSAIAIDNIELFENLQRTSTELIHSYDSTLEGWALALDLRDNETEGHTQRVTKLTVRLAGEMGFSDEEIVHIRRGALLHDIGKMGIPDHILKKPGQLTDEEWQVMREHPVLAYKMLSDIPFLRPALDIPYYHHEKWDGSGYPHGLAGEQIPLAARIFSIVDVYDALNSDRPYRKAWSKSKIAAYLREQKEVHFDPMVYEKFRMVFL